MGTTAAAWLDEADAIDEWPVRPVDTGIGVTVAVPPSWSAPRTSDEAMVRITRCSGSLPGEGLAVSRLDNVEADKDVTTWLELSMSVFGGLDPQTLADDGATEILQWRREPADGLAESLAADEAAAFSGLATFTVDGERPELIRSYVLLVRRGSTAWKIGLALSSACLPGTPDELVDANDHIRARAVFGGLRLT